MALSLQELCVRSAIDNVAHLSDVGDTDSSLLEVILPHCTADQLLHIETATKDRDLSPITNDLWKRIYERKFGRNSVELVQDRMEKRDKVFLWKNLYEAKLKEQDKLQQKGVERLRQLYEKTKQEKQGRRLLVCEKIPPVSRRRSAPTSVARGGGVSDPAGTRGRLMKKARMEFAATKQAKAISRPRR
eukprot:TRINITY_DN26981_c0_g1_i1.p1 TRINITY_DN26981_c0_g1~~TRINITY_DN26981_c0_g1_i1.p1  ORF type:complete len:215 (+),score=27.17 TRINITY_DN26981_c0_g1_i1:84-647(+)